ncbi:hypothetical protein [Streptomyces sp. AS58]|uniref:hypothetical protein n=1 Tax=Streptomyces sp. AS58 TaxID=1519489 RepID=UPI001F33FCE9|nr:hypothetical protein [Streptomyces sp. AS58]
MEDLYPQDKCGRITAKGGATEWIHWQSGTTQLLPWLIARRICGPLFLTDRKARPERRHSTPARRPVGPALLPPGRRNVRAETRLLANTLASPEDAEDLEDRT